MFSRIAKSIGIICVCVLGLNLSVQVSFARTVYVNSATGNDTTGDGTSGTPYKTFHKGYTEASAGDTLNVSGTFSWTDADETGDSSTTGYTLGKNLTIQGQGAGDTIVQAHSADDSADRRVFTISSGVTAEINDITIRYGKITGSSNYGGGIHNEGVLTVQRCAINYNRATGGGGGGINNEGTLTVRDSSVHHNVGYYMGGGLLNHYDNPSGTMDIINSTIAYNEQTSTVGYAEGAGVYYRRGDGSVTNSTIAYNDGQSTAGLGAGDSGTTVYVKNSIIAKNTGSDEIGYRSSSNGTLVESGYNIFGKTSSYFTSSEDNTWVDENQDGTYTKNEDSSTGSLYLSTSLADNSTDNGTQTLAITDETSIAVNAGDSADNNTISVPSQDQRGFDRSGTLDIGSYEFGGTSSQDSEEDSEEESGDEDGSSSSQSDTPGLPASPSCGDAPPSNAPDLFQIDTTQTTARLYFAPATNIDTYFISYSANPVAQEHGAVVQLGSDGVQQFEVELLQPNTVYYFKVRGQRGCAPGDWSQIRAGRTFPSVVFTAPTVSSDILGQQTDQPLGDDVADAADPEIPPDEQTTQFEDSSIEYQVSVQVKDADQPLGGVTVQLGSSQVLGTTDERGMVAFENVAKGSHTIRIVDAAFAVEETVEIDGAEEQFDIQITLDTNEANNQKYMLLAQIAGVTNIVLLIILGIRYVTQRK